MVLLIIAVAAFAVLTATVLAIGFGRASARADAESERQLAAYWREAQALAVGAARIARPGYAEGVRAGRLVARQPVSR